VPNAQLHEEQAQKLRHARKRLKEQRNKIKQQAQTLRYARQHIKRREREIRSQKREIFRLKNELRTTEERAQGSPEGRLTAPVAAGAAARPQTGALPDFVVIGAAKCGTTSFYDLLSRHPYVEPALEKELNYFIKNFDKGIEWYRSQLPPHRWKGGRRSITGEATASYLFHRAVPERMALQIPEARLIVLLRNPVDRAYSHYQYEVRTLRETRGFEEAIEAEKEWLLGKEDGATLQPRANVGPPRFEYLRWGIYVDHLLRWSRYFDGEQMLVLKSEDFYAHTLKTLELTQDFLHLPHWRPEPSMLSKPQNTYPKMDPIVRQRLEGFFEPHNRRLYEYLGVDFGWSRVDASATNSDSR
jgi:hypothetical protein